MITKESLVVFVLAVYISQSICDVAEVANNGTAPANETGSSNSNQSWPQGVRGRRSWSGRYVVFNERGVSFFEAWQTCLSYGLRLAAVTSPADTAQVQQALHAAYVPYNAKLWIAGTDHGRWRNWVWVSTNKPLWYPSGYRNWLPGEPNNSGGNEHCIELWNTAGAQWNDKDCDTRLWFICQKEETSC